MVRRILAGEIWTPEKYFEQHQIDIVDGKVTDIAPVEVKTDHADGVLDARDAIVIPGLVDLQVNGALGWSFQATHRDHYDDIIRYHAKNGTTTLLPTLVTADEQTLIDGLSSLADYLGTINNGTLPGIHLEGPFLASEKSGAHDQSALCKPELMYAQRLVEAAQGQIMMTTLAPELPDAFDVIRYFVEQDIIVSAGHSAATYADMKLAVDAGLSFVTHAGNASEWPHRKMGDLGFMTSEPGVVGSLMAEPSLSGGIILDGFHFHPALVAPLLQVKGTDHLMLVSDASTVAGCEPGEYDSGGLIVDVHPQGFATSGRGGGWLAGSIITLMDAIRVAVNQSQLDLQDAVKMASLSPAKMLKIDDRKGRIQVGGDADILILNKDLSIRTVIVQGEIML